MIELKTHNKILIFDLDNTIYQTHKYGVYDQLSFNIFNFISTLLEISYVEAEALSTNYQNKYGTTVLGLLKEHSIDPEDFLNQAYNVSFENVIIDNNLQCLLSRIQNNKKIIFTNATETYASKLLEKMGIKDFFHGIFDIYNSKFTSKPNLISFEYFESHFNIEYSNCIFIDDRRQNLVTASKKGAITILCNKAKIIDSSYINVHVKDIYEALKLIIKLR